MEKLYRPEKFSTTPESQNASKQWTHWYKTFTTFLEESEVPNEKKLGVLVNFLAYNNFEYISECTTFSDAIQILKTIYVPKKNTLFARHLLANRKQHNGETLQKYLQELKLLSKDCEFVAVDGQTYRDEAIRDAFISGLSSSQIRQRLLENNNITLQTVEEISLSLESAQNYSEAYSANIPHLHCYNTKMSPVNMNQTTDSTTNELEPTAAALTSQRFRGRCYFCGGPRHRSRAECPAKDANCKSCSKVGHFEKVCMTKRYLNKGKPTSASLTLASASSISTSVLSKAIVRGTVNNIPAKFLIDTGSSDSFISYDFVVKNKLKTSPDNRCVAMASSSLTSSITENTLVNLVLQNNSYHKTKLLVIKNLCTDVLIGHDLMKFHSAVNVEFGGPRSPFSVCNVACANVEPPLLFEHLTKDCHPIATKSRRFFGDDEKFIKSEIQNLLREGIIEESSSPWRAQVLITKSQNHKKRLVIDYSRTINRFTLLNAYPLPEIEPLVSKVAQYDVFSTIDLKSAYHQIPINENEKQYTAFEADGQLYQFKRIPFGVTNGVSAFQKTINKIISNENLEGVFAYLDDITIGGRGKDEHDKNLNKFLEAVKKYNLTLNMAKCNLRQDKISLLGYQISKNAMRPDPDRLKPLLDLPLPQDPSALRRVLGLFSHYSKWVPRYSDKIQNLTKCTTFPIDSESHAAKDFQDIKEDIANACLVTVEKEGTLIVESDASGVAIAATLSQNGRPVAFFSRTLSQCEKQHSAVEREAKAIVESLKKWRHFLLGRHFQLVTDQQALSFIFDSRHSSKIKNDKIMRWRLELSPFHFDIQYRPGKENVKADTLSRVCTISSSDNELFTLHQSLCHPGITRMYHWTRSKNLPYSLDEIKKVTLSCPICAEIKPRFHRSNNKLIKATSPFERLSIDFKGPLPSSGRNRYLLDIVDEYSRFPFAYPCKDMTSSTVIKCLDNLFSMFGYPCYIHSDRGKSFLSEELTSYLHHRGIATSLTTPYNPAGNGQIERYNGIIWRTISLSLKTKGLEQNRWEDVLPESLHSIRSLLCTATNCTPHERFFIHPRRSQNGTTLPTWLMDPGPVLVKRNVRTSKYEPIVEEAKLLEANPQYALIRHANGRESTVSLKQLAPRGDVNLIPERTNIHIENTEPSWQCKINTDEPPLQHAPARDSLPNTNQNDSLNPTNETPKQDVPVRNSFTSPNQNCESVFGQRPTRLRKRPVYLEDYVVN